MATRSGMAASAASCTCLTDHPLEARTASRVRRIVSMFSPTRSKLRYRRRSRSGFVAPPTPARARWSWSTGPDAPRIRVRSRSKIAADFAETIRHLLSGGRPPLADRSIGELAQLRQRVVVVIRQLPQVGHQLPAGDQSEMKAAVVAHDRDVEAQ